jgi:dTDP-4-dehydrorhamnose 3,5-epimerase
MTVVQGAAVIAAVPIDNWDKPSRDARVSCYVLSDRKPSVLYIPPGYANGFMSLSADARIMVYSTSTLQESQGDDVRYDARYWDVWQVVER